MTNHDSQTYKQSDLRGPECGACGAPGKLHLPFDKDLGTTIYASSNVGNEATVTFIPDSAVTA